MKLDDVYKSLTIPNNSKLALVVLDGIMVGFDSRLNVFDAVLFDSSGSRESIVADSDATVAIVSIRLD